ncbi:hypothetical protein Ancab_000458 [Ancistrocladus abbreviatus]
MDSMRTFDGYSKVDELQHQAVQMKRPHPRLILIAISSIVLVAILIGTIGGKTKHHRNNQASSSSFSSVEALCIVRNVTRQCLVHGTIMYNIGDEATKMALEDCSALFDYAVNHLNDSTSIVALNGSMQGSNERSLSTKAINDLKVSLGSAMTSQGRCLDKLDKLNEITTMVEGFKASRIPQNL